MQQFDRLQEADRFYYTDRLDNLDLYENFIDGTNFAGRFGGGVDLFATENVAIFLDASYTMPIHEVSDLYYFSFGWGAKYVF